MDELKNLVDTFLVEDYHLVESRGDNLVLRLVATEAGRKTDNNRVYSPEIWEAVAKDPNLQMRMGKRAVYGMLKHPESGKTDLEEVSHIVRDLKFRPDNKVEIEIEILEKLPHGQIAKALLESNCLFGVSSRGRGRTETVEGVEQVREYKFKTFDIVEDPAVAFTIDEMEKAMKSHSLSRKHESVEPSILPTVKANTPIITHNKPIKGGQAMDKVQNLIERAEEILGMDIGDLNESTVKMVRDRVKDVMMNLSAVCAEDVSNKAVAESYIYQLTNKMKDMNENRTKAVVKSVETSDEDVENEDDSDDLNDTADEAVDAEYWREMSYALREVILEMAERINGSEEDTEEVAEETEEEEFADAEITDDVQAKLDFSEAALAELVNRVQAYCEATGTDISAFLSESAETEVKAEESSEPSLPTFPDAIEEKKKKGEDEEEEEPEEDGEDEDEKDESKKPKMKKGFKAEKLIKPVLPESVVPESVTSSPETSTLPSLSESAPATPNNNGVLPAGDPHNWKAVTENLLKKVKNLNG